MAKTRLLAATAAMAVTLLVLAAPALGAVTIGPQTVSVTTPTAQAVITRVPFRISIDDGGGHPALAEVPDGSHLPAPLIPSDYPVPLGGKPRPDNDLYAPLTFLVGSATTTQWGGGPAFFQGNQQGGAVNGIQYSAQAVLSAAPDGDGVRLVVSTDDPSGRQLLVTVAPGPGGTMRVVATPSPSDGVALVSDAFLSDAAEQFHGFGGRHNAIDQHGNDFYSWIEEENSSGVPGGQAVQDAAAGQPNYMFPNGPQAAYMAQALFLSSRPYGFMLDQPAFARWRMDSDRSDAWQVTAYGTTLNYLVAPGSSTAAVGALTSVTGREPVPPAWSVAPEIDRVVRASNPQSPAEAQAEISSDLADIARLGLPVSAYRPETWTLLDGGAQTRLMSELTRAHIHLLRYFRAFVASPTGGFEPADDYSYAISHHLVATHADGSPATFGSPYQNGTAALLDLSNPATVAWWQGRIRQALDEGADGFMQDYGEQVDAGWHFADGETGATMHNRYPILYDKATREVIDQYEREHPGRRIYFFTRAGYSGEPGSTAYDSAEFLGDNTTSWDHASGIASVITDMLNRGVGGAYGPTTDIGGYLDLLTGKTTKEMLVRWAELSALTPFYRLHNSGYAGTQMPWNFDAETVAVYRAMADLHTAAEPLILRLWQQAERTGIPVMRPLWLAAPGDPQAAVQDQEWMLGPDVLVAPVTAEGASSRSVYVPAGCWRSPRTGATYHGPGAVTVAAPLSTLPYLFRCGTEPFAPPPAGSSIAARGCPAPSGRLTAAAIGPLHLGMTRARARRALPWSRPRATRTIDVFCLRAVGIRAGYPSGRLLRTLGGRERRRLRGRIVLLLTANRHYGIRGVRPGAPVYAARARLGPCQPLRIGRNTWYVCRFGAARAVLKARHGTVEEVGVAPTALTRTRRAALTFLRSFSTLSGPGPGSGAGGAGGRAPFS